MKPDERLAIAKEVRVSQVLTCRRAILRGWVAWLVCVVGTYLLFSGRALAGPGDRPVTTEELCKTHVTVDGSWIPYCRNERLGETRKSVRRAVILIHGKRRNARTYFRSVERLAGQASASPSTLLLAIQFLTKKDIKHHSLPPPFAYWTSEGWKHGHKSLNGTGLSSFDVIDRVIKRLIKQNPNLEDIVVAGHSAGAQLAQRHVLGRKVDTSKWPGRLHYVLGNAGSYMYLTDQRPGPTKRCKRTFNNYRYGFANNDVAYFRSTSPDTMWTNLSSARVTIFLGKQDTSSQGTDQSCEALAQGKNRFERGLNFFNSTMGSRSSSAAPIDQMSLHIVPGVGHEFRKMWDSKCGRSLLFGNGRCSKRAPPVASFSP